MKGRHANAVQITHTAEEVILDFVLIHGKQGVFLSRLILSPMHAKRILGALADNLKKYEEKFGEIKQIEMKKDKLAGEK